MSAVAFVSQLIETGRVRVGASPAAPGDLRDAARELDAALRPGMAFDPPKLLADVAEWGLLILYRGCQALVHREVEPAAVLAALATPYPMTKPSPAACYAADVALRFLPELIGLARGVAEDDPLVEGLLAVATAWPLSSVGVRGLPDALDVTPFIAHPSLRRLYADRIIERADVSRLRDPDAREAVREVLGAYPELAPPRIVAALAPTEEKQTCP
jgi:hypothetical protein